jgi:hypothetical protein
MADSKNPAEVPTGTTAAEAAADADRLVREKLAKGYREVDGGDRQAAAVVGDSSSLSDLDPFALSSATEDLIARSIGEQVAKALAPKKARRAPLDLDTFLATVRDEGGPVVRPRQGATEAQIKSLERAIGWGLPEGYRAFLGSIGYLDVTNVTVFGIAPRKLDCDLLAERGRVEKELKSRSKEASWSDDPLRKLVPSVPLVRLGPNSILFGEELFADARGRYIRTARGEPPELLPKGFNFERFVVEKIEEWSW